MMKLNNTYDSEFCGNVPLHNINLIQPHGYILILQKSDLKVIQASENCYQLFSLPLEEIFHKTFEELVGSQLNKLKELPLGSGEQKVPFYISLGSEPKKTYLILAHAKEQYLLVEIIPSKSQATNFLDVYQELKYSFAQIEQADSVPELTTLAAKQFKILSGFNRVMIYQFDENWNGKVIAEINETNGQNYLGHQFPASDIPKQARAMYSKNAYRLIPTVNYSPVKLLPVINPLTLTFTDISDCTLRSVAPVHLEYLKNMGVDASMSLRLIVNNQLWGLISFHHNTPLYPDFEACTLFELLADFLSKQLDRLLNKEKYMFATTINEKKTNILQKLYETADIEAALLSNQINVLDLFGASGAFVKVDDQEYGIGEIPHADYLQNLIFYLQNKAISGVFSVENVSKQFEEAQEYAKIASGMLAIELDREKGNYLICFRPEHEYTIDWGGNPNEAINFEADNKTYHPRNSFKLWKELVKNTARKWENLEIQVAQDLRSALFEFLSKHNK